MTCPEGTNSAHTNLNFLRGTTARDGTPHQRTPVYTASQRMARRQSPGAVDVVVAGQPRSPRHAKEPLRPPHDDQRAMVAPRTCGGEGAKLRMPAISRTSMAYSIQGTLLHGDNKIDSVSGG